MGLFPFLHFSFIYNLFTTTEREQQAERRTAAETNIVNKNVPL